MKRRQERKTSETTPPKWSPCRVFDGYSAFLRVSVDHKTFEITVRDQRWRRNRKR